MKTKIEQQFEESQAKLRAHSAAETTRANIYKVLVYGLLGAIQLYLEGGSRGMLDDYIEGVNDELRKLRHGGN